MNMSQVTVGISEMVLSNNPDDVITTHALGSCLGITIYDAADCVGGLIHIMLPLSSTNPGKAQTRPSMFVDTGIPKLFKESYNLGAQKERIVLTVAGGASVGNHRDRDYFEIGKRNIIMLRKLLWKNGIMMRYTDIGGAVSRTMSLSMRDGRVTVQSEGLESVLYQNKIPARATQPVDILDIPVPMVDALGLRTLIRTPTADYGAGSGI